MKNIKRITISLLAFLLLTLSLIPLLPVEQVQAASTEILRPDAAGKITFLVKNGTGGANWDRVDDADPDEDDTYVYFNQEDTYGDDYYNLQDHSVGSGTINKVKMYARCRSNGGSDELLQLFLYIPASDPIRWWGAGGARELTTSYVTYSDEWATNPYTTVAWTWDDIDTLQACIEFYRLLNDPRCTQVYVEVDYTPPVVAPTVTTQAASNVEETTATGNGNITDIGSASCTSRGIQYDTDSGVPYSSNVTSTGTFGTGPFTSSLIGLTKGELYYARAFAINSIGPGYGAEMTFLTKPDEPNTLVATSGVVSGRISLTWNKGIGAQNTYIRGKVGSYPADRTDGTLVYNNTGTSFNHDGLTGSDTWYYRAWSYATEGGLERYSDTYSQALATAVTSPVVTTGAASLVEETTATANGNMTSTGGVAVTIRGFEYDIDSGAPYASDEHEHGTYSTGPFTIPLTGLTKGKLYYGRAYATNAMGTGYGSQITFLTKPDAPTNLTVTPGAGENTLEWTKGAGANKTMVRFRTDGSYPSSATDGTQVYFGTDNTTVHEGLEGGLTYYYRIWSEVTGDGWQQFSDAYAQASSAPTAMYLVLYIDGVWRGEIELTGISLPDSDADWTFCTANVTRYVRSIGVNIGGLPVSAWSWSYAANIQDSIGTNHATSTSFRTTSSNDYVSATVTEQESLVVLAKPPVESLKGGWTMITEEPVKPTGIYDGGGTNFPGGAEIKATAAKARLPEEVFLFPLAFGSAIILGGVAFALTHRQKMGIKGSLLIMCFVIEGILIIWYKIGGGVIPGFVLIPFGLASALLLLWKNPHSPTA